MRSNAFLKCCVVRVWLLKWFFFLRSWCLSKINSLLKIYPLNTDFCKISLQCVCPCVHACMCAGKLGTQPESNLEFIPRWTLKPNPLLHKTRSEQKVLHFLGLLLTLQFFTETVKMIKSGLCLACCRGIFFFCCCWKSGDFFLLFSGLSVKYQGVDTAEQKITDNYIIYKILSLKFAHTALSML